MIESYKQRQHKTGFANKSKTLLNSSKTVFQRCATQFTLKIWEFTPKNL